MKEFLWSWIFWASFIFCTLLSSSLIVAYSLFSTAPHNPNTPIFAIGFGFAFGFIGLGGFTVMFFDRLTHKVDVLEEAEGELFKKVVKEMPFFFFALIYFFSLALFMGMLLLMIPFIRNACSS